jgi:hypothetical protein
VSERRRPARGPAPFVALVLVLALGAVAGRASVARAAQSGVERINTYDVDITVEATGSILVKETIDYDFGSSAHHGIDREVPVRLDYNSRFERVYPLDVVSVDAPADTPHQFKVSTDGRNKRIRIGDPKRTITGAHRYVVTYRVRGALNGFPDHDELYWNAIGTEWSVPIGRASARVTTPGAITAVTCFAGPLRSGLPCRESAHAERVATFSQGTMPPGSALTVVVGVQKGAVPEPTPVLDERWSASRAFAVTPATAGGSLALLALVVGLWGRLAWRTGRDRRYTGSDVDVAFGSTTGEEQAVGLLERRETPVELVPPDGIRPGQVGTLVDEVANPLDVTATIVDLAVRGYLRITEIPKHGWFGKPDWTLVKLKDGDDLLAYERTLLDGLFLKGAEVQLSELRNTFATRLKRVEDELYDDAVDRGWFVTRPDKVRARWYAIGAAVLVVAMAIAVVLAAFTHEALLGVPLAVGGLLFLLGAKRMPRRTARGTGVLRRVDGFRRFIDESEKDRARFAERQNLFSEYLPYAVVFGATEKWARAFAGLDGQLPATSWYAGSDGFTALAFAHSMEGFTVTTAGTIASTPSGSGSSGFSGGFSGGGGGGGGGGSW